MKFWAWVGIFFACWYLWIPITFWFGRVFCRWCCPLGLSQSLINRLFHPKNAVRRVCTRLPRSVVQKLVNWTIVLVYFTLPIGCFVHPWGIVGRVIFLFMPGVILFIGILVLAIFGKGRIWCNWVCPLGTIFDAVAKFGWHEDKIKASCINCRKCFPKPTPEASKGGIERREVLHGVNGLVMLAAAEKLTDGGFADVSLPSVPDREKRVMPPGALDRNDFRLKCVGCGLCIKACPQECLKPSVKLTEFGQPEMDFRLGSCHTACQLKCASVCPVGALNELVGIKKTDIHVGYAVWNKDICLRNSADDAIQCTACVRKCPVKAIHLVEGFPVVDRAVCIGCGACEHVCPARPMSAIHVEGYDRPRIIRPMNEADLIAEMRSLVEGGAGVVAARNGVIYAKEEGRGIAPLMKLFNERRLRSALVVDKVIGRAAAALCVFGGAVKVHGLVMSDDAKEFLIANGVEWSADKLVPLILNRSGDGRCPMELAIDGITEQEQIIEALRKATNK